MMTNFRYKIMLNKGGSITTQDSNNQRGYKYNRAVEICEMLNSTRVDQSESYYVEPVPLSECKVSEFEKYTLKYPMGKIDDSLILSLKALGYLECLADHSALPWIQEEMTRIDKNIHHNLLDL